MTKYSEKISDEQIEQIVEGTETAQTVAEKTNVPVSAVHNKKNRVLEKKKLQVGFEGKQADKTIPKDKNVTKDGFTTTGKLEKIQPEVPVDATEALKGFWGLVDGILKMVGFLSKGQIEYKPLEESDIDSLAKVSNNNETMRKIATMQGSDMIIVIGYAGMKFAPRIKLKQKPKHEDDNEKCQCEKCVLKRKIAEKQTKEKPKTVEEKIKETITNADMKTEAAKQEFIQRNLGSETDVLKAADQHMEKMKNLEDGRPKII